MSYNKMMKRVNGHRHDRDYQPILAMPFKNGEHVESYYSVAERTAESYHVRVRSSINEEFVKISDDFSTEDEAIEYCREKDLDNIYPWVRIYSDKGMHISGW